MKNLGKIGKIFMGVGIILLIGAAGSSDMDVIGIYEVIRKIAAGFFFIVLGGAFVDVAAVCSKKWGTFSLIVIRKKKRIGVSKKAV